MHYRSIAYVMGTLMLVTGVAMLFPVACSLYYGEDDLSSLLMSAGITMGGGFPLWFAYRKYQDLSIRDAYLIAVGGWVLISALSAMPFMIYGAIPDFAGAFFEMMSGYTTTGATVLRDIEIVPHGLLFWRSETHLLGGMGFLTLTIIFLPHGMGGVRIFRAESSPGQHLTGERLLPRNRDAMIWLWGIYLGLNTIHIILLYFGGMDWFDAMCHAFGTLSTSGYSTKNASVGFYDSAFIDWVTSLFMIMGGMNFMLFFYVIHRDWRAIRINTEFRWYMCFVLFFCTAVSLLLWRDGVYGFADAFRYGTFQVSSLLSTTGFTTADYELWPSTAQMFLYAVLFVGGCAGSTSSGIKVVHFAIIWKFVAKNVKKLFFQPMSVVSIRLNGVPIDQSIVNLTLCLFVVNIFLVFAGGCFISLMDGSDFTTAMTAVTSTLMNIGPGFGDVGPTDNYAHFTATSKWFLSYMMLVGRLETFTAMVVFYPSFWKK